LRGKKETRIQTKGGKEEGKRRDSSWGFGKKSNQEREGKGTFLEKKKTTIGRNNKAKGEGRCGGILNPPRC